MAGIFWCNMKKDYDKIAEIERAIKQKYGSGAIQNPAKSWTEEKEKDYLEQLQELNEKRNKQYAVDQKVEVDGFLVTRKLLIKENKINCPICCTRLKTARDDIYINKFDCCEKCFIEYVEDREKRWLEGWRPIQGEN